MPRTYSAGVPEKDLLAMINGYLAETYKGEPVPYTPEEVDGELKDIMNMVNKAHGDPFTGKILDPPLFVPHFPDSPTPVPAHLILLSQSTLEVEKENYSNTSVVDSSVNDDDASTSSDKSSPVLPVKPATDEKDTRLPQAEAITEMLHDTAANFPRSEMEELGRFHKLNLTFAPDSQASSATQVEADEYKNQGFDPDSFGETDPEVARKSMEDKFGKWLSKQRDGVDLTNPNWFGTGENAKKGGKDASSFTKFVTASSSNSAKTGLKPSANTLEPDAAITELASNVSKSLVIASTSTAAVDKQASVSNEDADFRVTDLFAGAPATADTGKNGKGKGKEAVKDNSRAAQIAKGKEVLSTQPLSQVARRALARQTKKKHRKPLPPPTKREAVRSKPEPEPEPEPASSAVQSFGGTNLDALAFGRLWGTNIIILNNFQSGMFANREGSGQEAREEPQDDTDRVLDITDDASDDEPMDFE
ncbi:hypothetical protein K491DRAFT_715987 [Lophiostoma macrostomum CBS 122681]|uniref:Uncharacterized protein n=1 Tax=Lophiostoma macrostomum CBS 122681 TaxID=1314788 RepID=A0A6A6T9U0_9PLEO|nr:hypothetical protein K491DRAFT_715987 [Lophiostoma macrostomum CBS 122681]